MSDATHDTTERGYLVRGVALLTTLLIVAWLLWSGLFKPLLLGLGLFSVLLTLYILKRMGYFANETFAFRYSPRLLGFWVWLGKEIVVSSLQVTRAVLSWQLKFAPQTVELDVTEVDALDQALLGNSITLTPGTLTLDVHEDRLLVHTLNPEVAEALKEGEMLRRVIELRDN